MITEILCYFGFHKTEYAHHRLDIAKKFCVRCKEDLSLHKYCEYGEIIYVNSFPL